MNKKILRLALPNIVSNITVPLLGMVDLSVVGHLDQVYYIGAVSLGTTIFNFIFWGVCFFTDEHQRPHGPALRSG